MGKKNQGTPATASLIETTDEKPPEPQVSVSGKPTPKPPAPAAAGPGPKSKECPFRDRRRCYVLPVERYGDADGKELISKALSGELFFSGKSYSASEDAYLYSVCREDFEPVEPGFFAEKFIMDNRCCFVSGHMDVTDKEFSTNYARELLGLVQGGASFVVGDAPGVDARVQNFLKGRTDRVTVYHMLEDPRVNVGFEAKGGFKTDEERDAAMTAASDLDLAWVRRGRYGSGTQKNLKRRTELAGV